MQEEEEEEEEEQQEQEEQEKKTTKGKQPVKMKVTEVMERLKRELETQLARSPLRSIRDECTHDQNARARMYGALLNHLGERTRP